MSTVIGWVWNHPWSLVPILALILGAWAYTLGIPSLLAAGRWLIRTEGGRALLILAAVVILFLVGRAHFIAVGRALERQAHKEEAMNLRLQAKTLELRAAKLSEAESRKAREAQDVRQEAINETWAKAQRLYANRPPVPAVCPSPDAGLLSDMEGATGRIGEARDQLRSLRAADHADAGDSDDR